MADHPGCEPKCLDDLTATSDKNILTAIWNTILNEADASRAAEVMLAEFGDVRGVFAADASELSRRCDLPPKLLEELERLKILQESILRSAVCRKPVLEDLESVLAYFRYKFVSQKYEQFHALFLDTAFRLLTEECLQTGTINHVTVYPRELVASALKCNASHVILVHNHPTGTATPSPNDIAGTRHLCTACAYLGIFIADHIIISQDNVFSFRAHKLLGSPELPKLN